MTDYLERRVDPAEPEFAQAFDELPLWSARFGILLLDHLELRRDLRVLDLGCGTGFPLLELAHAHGDSCRFVGADVWAGGLERAALKRRVHAANNVTLARADAAALPFADRRFDLIVSNLGVNNFESPRAALSECARVATPGARLVITTNPRGHMAEVYEVFRDTLAELGIGAARLAEQEDHRGTKESIAALIEECGFQVARIIESSFRLRYLDGTALLRHPLTRAGFLDGWRSVVEPPEESRVFAALEERLNRRARAAGGLEVTVPALYLEALRDSQ